MPRGIRREEKFYIKVGSGFQILSCFCFVKVYCVYQVQGDTHGAHGAHEAYDTRVFLFVFIKFCLIPFALVTFQGGN